VQRDDVLAGALLGVLGVAALVGAVGLRIGTPLRPQPGFFPFLGACALIGLSVTLVLQAGLGRSTGSEAFGEVGRPAALVAGMAVYVAILEPLGYVPATLLLAWLMLRVLRVTSWRAVAVSSVLLAVGTYLVFRRVLGIDLPPGLVTFLG
jgi:putative tricarboxylic transport membrane protein